jgi:hypothetical protein
MKKEIKKCEICGKMKATSEMSKSYKHRCKACVAEMVRSKRVDRQNSCNKKCIDWEQRRYELAKVVAAEMLKEPTVSWHDVPKYAIELVDNLIKELKGVNNESVGGKR